MAELNLEDLRSVNMGCCVTNNWQPLPKRKWIRSGESESHFIVSATKTRERI